MTKQVFNDLTISDEPYLYLYCAVCSYKKEMQELNKQVNLYILTKELGTLKNKLAKSNTTAEPSKDNGLVSVNYCSVDHATLFHQITAPPKPTQATSEKKFNLIIILWH